MKFQVYFVKETAAVAPKVFPRHRFTGSAETARQVGLLLAIHGQTKSVAISILYGVAPIREHFRF